MLKAVSAPSQSRERGCLWQLGCAPIRRPAGHSPSARRPAGWNAACGWPAL